MVRCKNTTDKLISDLNLITTRFGLERYILFGGSWGATLALLCAMEHPGRASVESAGGLPEYS